MPTLTLDHPVRLMLEAREKEWLDPRAMPSTASRGRLLPEEPDPLRTAFQRDRDRILHCKAFRRMKHKTQVFVAPELDHYRTRLTHTLEVTQIARTVTRSLRLNEDLTEAIGMGHDMGHAPFGHDGEYALDEAYRKVDPNSQFRHYEQSLRIADKLERGGLGLNLTWEVRDGILYHSKGKKNLNVGGTSHWKTDADLTPSGVPSDDMDLSTTSRPGGDLPATLEGQILRMCDRIAYVNHDIDDAIRAGLIKTEDLPEDCISILGTSHSVRITKMVTAVIEASTEIIDGQRRAKEMIEMEDEVREATDSLKNWMFQNVYMRKTAVETPKVRIVILALFEEFMKKPELMQGVSGSCEGMDTKELARCVCDYIAGMTDRYASQTYADLFLPASWRGV